MTKRMLMVGAHMRREPAADRARHDAFAGIMI